MLLELLSELDDPELDDPELLLLLLELLSDDALLVDSVRGFLRPLSPAVFCPRCWLFLSFSDDTESLVLCWDLLPDDFSLASVPVFRLSLVTGSSTVKGDRVTLSL